MNPADNPANADDDRAREEPERYRLRLYVAGATPSSANAIQAIEDICHERLEGRV